MKINEDLKKYIEENIFPEYAKNDLGHNIKHIQYVIDRSFKFADTVPNVNYDIVYTVAAYHDIGHHIDSKRHEIVSGEIMSKDENLKRFFSADELKIIREAIEDHRASADHEPRSIYGKIVSTADRNNTVEACLKRSYTYGKKLNPEATDDELFDRAYEHLKIKFGENGYAKFFFKDDVYEKFLKDTLPMCEKAISFLKHYVKDWLDLDAEEILNKLKENGEL